MTTQTGDPANVAEVLKVFDHWLAGIRACRLDAVTDAHTSDVVMFDVPDPPMISGIDAYRETWKNFFPWFGAKGIFDPSEFSITAGDDVAFSHCLVRCVGSTPSDVEKPVRVTICYHKIGGRWLIAHEHHSVALDMGG